MPCQTEVGDLWRAAWTLLLAQFPDAEERLAALPRHGKVARLEASAARRGARAARGEAPLPVFVARLREWQAAAEKALAEQDHARSLRLCADCGSPAVPTVAPGLTGGRVCSRCLREVAA